jgi:hypothetical protein
MYAAFDETLALIFRDRNNYLAANPILRGRYMKLVDIIKADAFRYNKNAKGLGLIRLYLKDASFR